MKLPKIFKYFKIKRKESIEKLVDDEQLKIKFVYPEDKEIAKIVENSALRNKIKISNECIKEIAEHSRQTPRIANNLLKRTYDFLSCGCMV